MQCLRLPAHAGCCRCGHVTQQIASLATPRCVAVGARVRRSSAGRRSGKPSPTTGGRGFSAAELNAAEEEEETGLPAGQWASRDEYKAYVKPEYLPPRTLGAVEIRQIPGKGRGLVASQDAILGDLLAVSKPLVVLEGGFGEAPSVEDLHVFALEEGLSAAKRKVLELLYDGTPASLQRPATLDHLDVAPQSAALTATPGAPPPPPLDAAALKELLDGCCYSEEYQDPAAMQMRHQKPMGFIGVWPEFTMLNHSCAPNVSVTVVGDRMLLHASADVPAGGELTTNYIGRYVAAPLAVRRARLQEDCGFRCDCARCRAEDVLPEELSQQLQQLHAQVAAAWAPAFAAAVETGDGEALAALQEEIAGDLETLEDALEGLEGLDDTQKRLVQAGAYDAYDLACQAAELLSPADPDPRYLRTCLSLVQVFAAGSESHTAIALRYQELQERRVQELTSRLIELSNKPGPSARAQEKRVAKGGRQLVADAEAATAACFEAYFARYGFVSPEVVEQLKQGQRLFYEGLEQLAAAEAAAGGGDGAPAARERLAKELFINGVKVTVVDTVDGVGGVSFVEDPSAGEEALSLEDGVDAIAGASDDEMAGETDGQQDGDELEDGAEDEDGEFEEVDLDLIEALEAGSVAGGSGGGDATAGRGQGAVGAVAGAGEGDRYIEELMQGQDEELSALIDGGWQAPRQGR